MASRKYEIRKESNKRYFKENLDQITLRVKKGMKEVYKRRASAEGKSLNAYIVEAIEQKDLFNHIEELLYRFQDTGDKLFINTAIDILEDKYESETDD